MSKPVFDIDFNYYDGLISEENLEGIEMLDPNFWIKERPWIPESLDEVWVKNYEKNRDRIELFEKQDVGQKPVILVGASTAIKKNTEKLLSAPEDFTIVCCNTSLKYLLFWGVKPDYVFAVEGGDHIAKDFDCETEDLTLIASPFISHEALKRWKGKTYFYMIGGGKQYNNLLRKDWEQKCDIDIGGGNVVSTSFLWAYKYLNARHFIVTGMSLCYYDDYYHDGRKKKEDLEQYRGRYMAMDIYGNIVNTTPALTNYKTWLETYVKYAIEHGGGSFINATEDGILGVLPKPIEQDGLKVRFRPVHVPWISVVPLDIAIRGHKERLKDTEEEK